MHIFYVIKLSPYSNRWPDSHIGIKLQLIVDISKLEVGMGWRSEGYSDNERLDLFSNEINLYIIITRFQQLSFWISLISLREIIR